MTPSCERRAGANRYLCRDYSATSRFRETTVLREAGWFESALVFDAGDGYRLAGCGANLFGQVVSQFEFLMGCHFLSGLLLATCLSWNEPAILLLHVIPIWPSRAFLLPQDKWQRTIVLAQFRAGWYIVCLCIPQIEFWTQIRN